MSARAPPNRFTGPFLKEVFREFGEIQLVLQGNGASWYYNDYWNSAWVIQDIYKRYYKFYASSGDHVLPESSPTPSPDGAGTHADPRRPGAETGPIPEQEGANGILLELKGIYYTSLFGGSLKLVFEKVDDYYYEFRFDPFIYDLQDLELHMFFVPFASALNPTPIQHSSGILYGTHTPMEHGGVFNSFVKSIKGVYVLKYPDTDLGCIPIPSTELGARAIDPETLRGPITYENNKDIYEKATLHLNKSLLDWNLGHGSPGTDNAPVSFAYGFLHQLHQESIPTPMIRPKRISIQENDFDLVTEQGEFSFRVSCVVSRLDSELTPGATHTMQHLYSHHYWKPAGGTGKDNTLHSKWKIERPYERAYTWHNIFRYNFEDADELLNKVRLHSTEEESMDDAEANIRVKYIIPPYSLIRAPSSWNMKMGGDLSFTIPIVNDDPLIDSVCDLARREVGGTILDDTITIELYDYNNNEENEGITVDIRVAGHLRIK